MIGKIPHFRFWCQKVLPLVYDNSLSYYEVLCKVVHYINKLIDDDKVMADEIDALRSELLEVQNWIDNFDTTELEKMIENLLLKMIIVGINDEGYMVISIPQSWYDITFGTTGYDIIIPGYDFGHLVLSY